jgi:hypothetical protein
MEEVSGLQYRNWIEMMEFRKEKSERASSSIIISSQTGARPSRAETGPDTELNNSRASVPASL